MNSRTELSPSAQRIAEVAQNLVQEVGYNGFSFEHIAKEVGMRKASVHPVSYTHLTLPTIYSV